MGLFLGGPSGGDGRYEITFFYKGLPVDEVLSGIKWEATHPCKAVRLILVQMVIGKARAEMYVQLPVAVLVKGTTVTIPKLGQTQLDSLIL